jgi:hypothetical protein
VSQLLVRSPKIRNKSELVMKGKKEGDEQPVKV